MINILLKYKKNISICQLHNPFPSVMSSVLVNPLHLPAVVQEMFIASTIVQLSTSVAKLCLEAVFGNLFQAKVHILRKKDCYHYLLIKVEMLVKSFFSFFFFSTRKKKKKR